MRHSDKISAQLLFSAFQKAGIEDIIISPGSRNAPLVIESLARGFSPRVIVDERVAGFTALGIAQQTRKPAVLICTSGTAVLNYHPAVAEAFYARIPLIVVSADRPPYRIDKGEGQTIRQDGVLKNHTHLSVTLPFDGETDTISKHILEAIHTAFIKKGPVHINIPFEEPLYEYRDEVSEIQQSIQTETPVIPVSADMLDMAEKIWKTAKRKLIIVSQLYPGEMLEKQLERLAAFDDTVILTENISNVKSEKFLEHIDRLVFPFDDKTFKPFAPDLVITVGNNIISKKIKFLIRANKPQYGHWHIGQAAVTPDTFDVLSMHFDTDPQMFLSQLLFRIYDFDPHSTYKPDWKALADERKEKHSNFLSNIPFGDFKFYDLLSKTLLPPYQLQWGNSTVVRYAQLVPFERGIRHFSNRGTSGIDGSLSTAIGAALRSDEPVLAVTGDLAFHYDGNAFWQNFPDNLKIIVIIYTLYV